MTSHSLCLSISPVLCDVSSAFRRSVWDESVDPGSGLTYYYNRITRESVWERPPDYVKVPHVIVSLPLTTGIRVSCQSCAENGYLGGEAGC